MSDQVIVQNFLIIDDMLRAPGDASQSRSATRAG
jgi:hypothetical protein